MMGLFGNIFGSTKDKVAFESREETCGRCECFEKGVCREGPVPVRKKKGDWCSRFEKAGLYRQKIKTKG